MFSLSLTRWLMGYVRFAVIGGSLERFLNQCARSGIYLWDISSGTAWAACVPAGRYRSLHRCARRAGCRLKVSERHGLPFATKGIRKRRGLVAGGVVFASVLIALSMHVWSFEVVGNTTIPTADITTELATVGMAPGALKRDLHPAEIQHVLMLKFPQISWMSVNTRGCTAEIRLEEKTEKPPIETKDTRPCNIKAAFTGQIVSLEVYAGKPLVKEGDAVVQGQLLVSGTVENEAGETSLKRASARVFAETTRSMTVEVPLRQSVEKATGNAVVRRSLNFMGVRIPLTFTSKPSGNYSPEVSFTKVRLMNTVLPLSVYEENWVEHKTAEILLTKQQALAQAEQMMLEKQNTELKDAKILSSSTADEMDDSRLIYTVMAKCRENIAQESEIIIN